MNLKMGNTWCAPEDVEMAEIVPFDTISVAEARVLGQGAYKNRRERELEEEAKVARKLKAEIDAWHEKCIAETDKQVSDYKRALIAAQEPQYTTKSFVLKFSCKTRNLPSAWINKNVWTIMWVDVDWCRIKRHIEHHHNMKWGKVWKREGDEANVEVYE